MTPASTPIRWPAETIWQSVSPHLPGFTVEVLPAIDSSNTELLRRFKSGRSEPTLLVAEHQTAGRGRLGRHWHSTRADSLTFSLGLSLQPADWSATGGVLFQVCGVGRAVGAQEEARVAAGGAMRPRSPQRCRATGATSTCLPSSRPWP